MPIDVAYVKKYKKRVTFWRIVFREAGRIVKEVLLRLVTGKWRGKHKEYEEVNYENSTIMDNIG